MRIFDTMGRMKAKFSESEQVRAAASQMWAAVQHGATFEVPFNNDINDPTMRAVWLLFRLHPEMRTIIRQSRSFIITHPKSHHIRVSDEVQEVMRKGGQFGSPEEFLADIGKMLAGQAAFLHEQGLNIDQMVREAKHEEAEKHAISVESTSQAEASTNDGPKES